MTLEYNTEEKKLFNQIVDQVASLLEIYYDSPVEIKVNDRFRKFNFSITVNKVHELHVKTFIHTIENGEEQCYPWKDAVLVSTKAIYELNRENSLDLPIPELIALDRDFGIIITKMVVGKGLDEILLGDSKIQAIGGLMSMAKSLAQFHGMTIGMGEKLQEIIAEMGSEIDRNHWVHSEKANIDDLSELLHKYVTSLNPNEIELLMSNFKRVKAYVAGSELQTMVNSDLCPDNLILEFSGDQVTELTMIDLDTFTFYNPFIDVYYLWIRASCWCVGEIEDEIVREMEQAYLTEICNYTKMAESEFYSNLFMAGLVWTIIHLRESFRENNSEINIKKDSNWGRATMGERFHRRLSFLTTNFQLLKDIIADHEDYEVIKACIEGLTLILDEFSKIEEVRPLAKYPVFE